MRLSKEWLAFSLITVIVIGCGGARPTAFSDKTRPLADSMKSAIAKKDMKQVDRVVETAEPRVEKGTIQPSEMAVLKACQKYGQEGNWEAAEKLISDSLLREK